MSEATPEALTVSQLQRKISNAIAREFRGYVWVTGEIKSLREQRGSLYINLVEPEQFSGGGDVMVDVACWPKPHAILRSQLTAAGIKLVAGMQVRIHGSVAISKLGKIQLVLHALDVESLVGRQANEKRKLYETLQSEGLIDRNRQLATPLVPLRIGLVTSADSEGFRDFMGQLQSSPFAFSVSLAHSPVQGPTAPQSLARAIASFDHEAVDLIAVVRGGGGELEAFDKEPVARAIAGSPLPIWTGIGHTGDHSVADDLAQQAHITPTACGQAVVRTVSTFATRLEDQRIQLSRTIKRVVEHEQVQLGHQVTHLQRGARNYAAHASFRLARQSEQLLQATRNLLDRHHSVMHHNARSLARSGPQAISRSIEQLALLRAQASAGDPRLALQRGYTYTQTSSGRRVRSVKELEISEELVTVFVDGTVRSSVSGITPTKEAAPS